MSTPSSSLADHGIIIPVSMPAVRDPEKVLAEAANAAAALKRVVEKSPKHLQLQLNGQTYLFFEHWQTVGRFFGACPRVCLTKPIVYPALKIHGFFAKADAVEIVSGNILSSADAICMTDEKVWRSRPIYEYPKGKRTKVGEDPVPYFQRRSMAQTRACVKALKNAFSWVVVLAGYSPTPAEEMDEFNQDQVIAHCAGCDLELYDAKEIADSRTRFGTATCKVCVKKIDQRKATQSVESRRAEYSQQAGD